jgi:hypothetical protein
MPPNPSMLFYPMDKSSSASTPHCYPSQNCRQQRFKHTFSCNCATTRLSPSEHYVTPAAPSILIKQPSKSNTTMISSWKEAACPQGYGALQYQHRIKPMHPSPCPERQQRYNTSTQAFSVVLPQPDSPPGGVSRLAHIAARI